MWEVPVYGGGELYRSIFNAVALMTNMSATSSMIALAMMLGLVFGLVKAIFDVNIGKILKWYIMCAIIYGVLWVPKVTVQVVDRLNPGVTYANVANVPLGVGVASSLISRVGDRVITLTETAFSDPADLQYSRYGMVFGAKLYSRISEARPIDQQLYLNLKTYIQDCVFYDILDGTIAPDALNKTDNLWSAISTNPNPARTMQYYAAGGNEIKTCDEVGNGSTGLLAPLIAADLPNIQKVIQRNVDPYALEASLTTRNAGASGAMLTAMGVASQNSTDVLRQAVMANMLRDGLGNNPSASDALAGAQAEIQTHNAQKLLGLIGEKAVVNLKILIDLLFIGIFPTLFPIFLFPEVGPRMIKGYLGGFVYLQLWGPMYVILHKVMMFNSVNRSVDAMYIPGSDNALSLMNMDAVAKANDDVCALAGSMMLMIPVIAGMLTKGAMAIGGQGEALLSNFRSGAEAAAASKTTGNYTYGAVALDTLSFNNVHGNQQVTSSRYDSGNMRMSDGFGNEVFYGGNGSTGIAANATKMATGVLSSHGWSESLGRQSQSYQDTGQGLRHSVSTGTSVANSHISEAFTNWSQGKEWRNSNNSAYLASIGKMLNIADEAVEYRRKTYGESEAEARAQIASGSMGVGGEVGASTPGGKLKGLDASASITANASKTGQTTGTRSKNRSEDAGIDQRFSQARSDTFQNIATDSAQKSYASYRSQGSGGRDVEFDMFASEILQQVTVHKSPTAADEEGGIAGSVDITTARPFDYKDDQLVVSAQASYNDLARDVQPRVTMMGSRRWADGRLGALFSVAYEKRHILEEGANITRWSAGGANGGFNTQSTLAGYTIAEINNASATTGLFHPRLPSYVSYDINTERLGLTGSFQMRPSDATLVTFDVLYSDVKTTRGEHQFQAIGLSRSGVGKPQTIIRSGIVEGRNIVQATMDNVDLRSQTAWDEMETEFTQYTLTLTHNFSDRLRGGLIAGHSQSEFSNPVSTIITFDRANTQGYSYDFRSRMPAINLNFDATDPANWSMTNGTSEVRIRPNFVTNAFANAKAYLEYDFSDNFTVKGGIDYRKFTFDSRGYYRTSETRTDTLSASDLAAVSEVFSGFGRNLDQPSGNATSWLAPDLNKFAEKYDIYCNCGIYALTGTANSSARGQWIDVREANTGAYLQADFKFNAFGLPWRGDAGVRHVKTDQRAGGYASTGSGANLQIEWVESERSYDMTLPSGNLAADLTDDVVFRISAAETIARPSISGLTPGGNVSIQGSNYSYSRGNPVIEPTKSKNLDLSLEWYPAPNSLFAAGVFYKKIDTFVQTVVERIPFDQLGLPLSLLTPTNTSPSEIFNVSQPFNSPGGELKGFEINAQQQLDFLPGFWANFGVLANYTYVDSSIDYLTSTSANAAVVNETLIGLSKNAANFTLYYETEKFSVRGSAAYREG
ncbi:MAG: hypothetical protein B7Z26_00390, partial [Asticcacaulis sp. 32-58-5]